MMLTRLLVVLVATLLMVAEALLVPGLVTTPASVAGITGLPLGPAARGGIEAALCLLLLAAGLQLRPRAEWRLAASAGNLAVLAAAGAMLVVAVGAQWVAGRLGLEVPSTLAWLLAAVVVPADPLVTQHLMRRFGPEVGRRIGIEPLIASIVGLVVFEVALRKEAGFRGAWTGQLFEQAGGALLLAACLSLAAAWALRVRPGRTVAVAAVGGVLLVSWVAGRELPLNGPLTAALAGLILAFLLPSLLGPEDRAWLDRLAARSAGVISALAPLALLPVLAVAGTSGQILAVAFFVVPLVLVSRALLVGASVGLLGLRVVSAPRGLARGAARAGLRGGFTALLVLLVPAGEGRELLLTVAGLVLVVSWMVQWPMVRSLAPPSREEDGASPPESPVIDQVPDRAP